ncbi:hypothetical protein [Streptomyces sp. NPDC018693]|uniref:hypothetical protein n=1 Tax=unclassified Streptomyces TaxID=2593676 RepID=UPI0037884C57
MYGHGAAPPSRSTGTVITLRVLFAAAGFLSCGLLACVPLFRVAHLRGRWYDWTAAWVSLPLSVIGLAVAGSVPESDARGDVAVAVVLILGAASAAYFLTVDIQLGGQRRQLITGYAPPHATTTVQPPYGYPQAMQPTQPAQPMQPTPPVSPYQTTLGPGTHPIPPGPHTPVPGPPLAHTSPPVPGPVPPPQRPAPARIDQVRAELDELSDFLRKQEGRQDGGDPESGR